MSQEAGRVRARIAAGLGLALAANSLYLGARTDASLLYFGNVVLHLVLGFALAAAAFPVLRRRWSSLPGLVRMAGVAFAGAAAFGIFLMVVGATRPWRWALWSHVALAALGALLLLVQATRSLTGGLAPAGVAAAALALLALPARFGADVFPPEDRMQNPSLPPESMDAEGAGAGNPFFPSSSETNIGGIMPATFFMTSATCRRCHQDIYDQWNSSAHHFSSFNNQWYRKSVEYMQDVVGTQPSKWCAGCHDHAMFFNGRFDRPAKEQIDTPEAQNGLGCTSCHAIVHVKSTMGNGDFTIEYPPLHDLAADERPFMKLSHDYLLRLDPGPHARTFLKSFHTGQTAEFCSACHKVHLDVPVNAYRWFRGFNEYDNWQASGVSGQGARSFYYPPAPQKCADCHMPLVASNDPAARDGKVHSHRFPAANTALPFVNQDETQLKVVQDFLRAGQVSVDVFGIVREPQARSEAGRRTGAEPQLASTFAVGEESLAMGAGTTILSPPAEVIAPLDKLDLALPRGESVRVEVVLRTRKVGHFFPGGTVDAFDVWVELEAIDSNGKTLLHSGWVGDGGKGPVDASAHFYRSLMLDELGGPISRRNAWMARSVAYVRLIPPGAADTIHYRLQIPKDCGDRVTLRAKVNYRKFAWWNTQWSFAGVRDPAQKDYSVTAGHDTGHWVFTGDTSKVSGKVKAIPDIPITVMAEAEASFRVVGEADAAPAPKAFLDASVRERWNDYGIGLLLQGDLKGAEAAFLKVTQMEPGYADGWVNVARARVQEGNPEAAAQVLRRALEVNPRLASAHFFLGLTLKARGRYDEALDQLRQAASQYPRDRVVANQIGRVLFLQRRFGEAVHALTSVLAIDPEDLSAHYNLMLSYRGLGNTEMANKHEKLYQRFKADESSQFITGPYRKLHPYDNNERQAVHEHDWQPQTAASYTRSAQARPSEPRAERSGGGAAGASGGGR